MIYEKISKRKKEKNAGLINNKRFKYNSVVSEVTLDNESLTWFEIILQSLKTGRKLKPIVKKR